MSTIEVAFARIEEWMEANGAEVIVDNLAPGASDDELDSAEARLGFRLPTSLRELWSVHDGQLTEQDGFYESYDLLSSRQAHSDTFEAYLRGSTLSARSFTESGLDAREVDSKAWLMIAARDSDGIAVNADTGRVFRVAHDDAPCLHFLAPSVEAWLTTYADHVCNDDYRVEEGFGEAYLERRDRAAEARAAAADRARAAESARRASLSPVELMTEAVRDEGESKAREALSLARARDQEAVMSVLFRADAAFAASVLRPDLRKLTLSREQWEKVAEGGRKLGNDAIVAYARKMATP